MPEEYVMRGSFSFETHDQRALALLYSEAAQDAEFKADNEAIERDFVSLDHEVDAASNWVPDKRETK